MTTNEGTAIRLRNVQVCAGGRTLLDIERFEIRTGERIGIVGPNGAGKSTLLRACTGFAPLARGEAHVLGCRLAAGSAPRRAQLRELRAQVGQVVQGLHLVPRLTARENVLIGACARMHAYPFWRNWLRLPPAHLIAQADAALADQGMLERADIRADRLSGGERQKVALARVVLQRPRLVLADEPTAALDPAATRIACATLRSAASGNALLCVVHQPDLLAALADRVLGLAHGRIQWDLPVGAVDAHALRLLYGASGPPAPTLQAEAMPIPTRMTA